MLVGCFEVVTGVLFHISFLTQILYKEKGVFLTNVRSNRKNRKKDRKVIHLL